MAARRGAGKLSPHSTSSATPLTAKLIGTTLAGEYFIIIRGSQNTAASETTADAAIIVGSTVT
jgi:hypothetical protein